MKVIFYDWYGDADTARFFKDHNLTHNEGVDMGESAAIEKSMEFFRKGANVNLRHIDGGIVVGISCKYKGWGQRG